MDYRLTTLSVMLIILCILIILVVRYKNNKYEEVKKYIDFIEKTLNEKLNELRSELSYVKLNRDIHFVTRIEYDAVKKCLSYYVDENIKLREHNSKLKEELDQLKVPVNCCKGLEIGKESNYQCECGSEEFTRLRGSEQTGIKGEIPYHENEYQCTRCGRLHTIKQKMYGTNIQLDRVIKKEV